MEKKEIVIVDTLLEAALSEYLETEGKDILKDIEANNNDPNLEITAEEQKKYHLLIKKAVHQKYKIKHRKKFVKLLNRVAVICLVVLVGISTCILTVDAFRAEFLNLFVNPKENHAEIEFNSSQEASKIPDWVSLPQYIPKNFYETSAIYNKDNVLVDYTNTQNNNFISFTQDRSENITAHIDTEEMQEYKNVDINGIEGIYMFKEGYSTLTWQGSQCVFGIFSQLSEEEVIKIAESVEIK